MKIFLVVMLVLTVAFHLQADAAALRSDEFGEHIRRIVNDGYMEGQRTQRATENTNEEEPKRNCYYDTPCGWYSYNTTTRRRITFMPNICKCPDETYKCTHTGDSVSMSSYVYHCRQNLTADDLEAPDYTS